LVVEVDKENPTRTWTSSTLPCPNSPGASTASSRTWTSWIPHAFGNRRLPLKPFTPEETREIVFKTMLDSEVDHTIQLDGTGPATTAPWSASLPAAAERHAPGRRL
jgi:type III restriction enzyme